MATSNASEQHIFHSPNYPQQIESDVDLRHRLGISDMRDSVILVGIFRENVKFLWDCKKIWKEDCRDMKAKLPKEKLKF